MVTGAGAGIGAALAWSLAHAGAKMLLMDLDAERVETVARDLRELGHDVIGRAGDAADTAFLKSAIGQAEQDLGEVDIFIANAGTSAGLGLDADETAWSSALNVNVLAQVRAARLLVPSWVERGAGYFVSVASAAGLLTQFGSPTYSVSKHAAVAFAEWLSVTYGDQGIVVSCVCPMGVETELLRTGFRTGSGVDSVATRAVREAGTVLSPSDVADTVLAGIVAEQFLILPHPEVLDFYRRKAEDYDGWISGMRRYQRRLLH